MALLPPEEALAGPEVRPAWDALLGIINPLNRLHGSPTWVEHLRSADHDAELRIAVIRDGAGRVIGTCPIAIRCVPLVYDIASHELTRMTLRSAVILGGEPMMPGDPEGLGRFFDGLFDAMPAIQSIYIGSLPVDSLTGTFLLGEGWTSRRYISHLPGAIRPWYWIEPGDGPGGYLRTLSSKSRYNLRRQVRELNKHGGGSLELIQVDAEHQVEAFLELADRISSRSWQHRVLGRRIGADRSYVDKFRDLARRSLLRAFLLKCGPEPCAFVVGYQFEGVYHYEEIGFDPSFAHLSPGTTLLYLILEEFSRRNPPSALNFGIGDAPYKRRFANREGRDASVVLFRRGGGNRVRRESHRAFLLGVGMAKRLLRRRP